MDITVRLAISSAARVFTSDHAMCSDQLVFAHILKANSRVMILKLTPGGEKPATASRIQHSEGDPTCGNETPVTTVISKRHSPRLNIMINP